MVTGESKTYSRNFITKVIFRLDYDEISSIENVSTDILRGKFSELFLSYEQEKFFVSTIQVNKGLQDPVTNESKLWLMKNEDAQEILAINKDFLTYEVSSYKNFTSFFSNIKQIFSKLQELHPSQAFNKIGLRYINEIKLNESNPLDWKQYIHSELISPLNFFSAKDGDLSKELVQLSLNKSDFSVGLVIGMWNSEYPNPITKKELIMDIDCRTLVPIEASEVLAKTTELNAFATEVFERATSDEFKSRLLTAE